MKEQTIGIILFVVILVSSVVLNIYVRKKSKMVKKPQFMTNINHN